MPGTLFLRGLLTVVVCGGALVTAVSAQSYYEKALLEKRIKPTTAGLNAYFHSLHLDQAQRQRALKLIEQMGTTDSFSAREAAMAKLLIMPVLPTESLIAASQGKDPEIRWRARKVLKLGKPESQRILFAAFKTVEQKPIRGVTAEMLRAIPLCDKSYLRSAARQAVLASVRPNDAATLRRGMKSKNIEVRIAAILGFGKALGRKSSSELDPLLEDSQDRVKLAAARSIANFGGRNCLKTLASLLSSNDVAVRSNSSAVLRQLTGQRFQFAAYDVPDKRAKARDKWVAWIKANGRTAKLKFPLARLNVELGRTLVCSRNMVIEYDAGGKKTWEARVTNPWGCYGLPDGRRFVASHNNKTVTEYDASGKLTKVYKLPGNPYDVQVLKNGNFLVPCHGSARAFEVRRDGSVAWENRSGYPVGATRLENGNTLLCMHNRHRVIEVDPTGKEVWRVNGVTYPYTAQRLENGNTLIYMTGRRTVSEYDPSGKVVWSKSGLQGYDVQRLSNGNTLIVQNGLREIEPGGKTVWHIRNLNVTRFHRY